MEDEDEADTGADAAAALEYEPADEDVEDESAARELADDEIGTDSPPAVVQRADDAATET
jgi:hypothetical protein